jgi:copper(I)-binding protein
MRTWMGVLTLIALAHSATASVVVENAWARATPPGTTVGVVYAQLRSDMADEVVSLSSPVAERAEIHASINEGGMMKMRKLDALALPAGASVTLQPAGTHIMLIGLRSALRPGASFDLTLHFRTAAPVTLKVRVLAPGEEPRH